MVCSSPSSPVGRGLRRGARARRPRLTRNRQRHAGAGAERCTPGVVMRHLAMSAAGCAADLRKVISRDAARPGGSRPPQQFKAPVAGGSGFMLLQRTERTARSNWPLLLPHQFLQFRQCLPAEIVGDGFLLIRFINGRASGDLQLRLLCLRHPPRFEQDTLHGVGHLLRLCVLTPGGFRLRCIFLCGMLQFGYRPRCCRPTSSGGNAAFNTADAGGQPAGRFPAIIAGSLISGRSAVFVVNMGGTLSPTPASGSF